MTKNKTNNNNNHKQIKQNYFSADLKHWVFYLLCSTLIQPFIEDDIKTQRFKVW